MKFAFPKCSEMTLVEEGSLAHAGLVGAESCPSHGVIGLSPSYGLRSSKWSCLNLLVLVNLSSMLAPSAFSLALLAVLMWID